MPRVLLNFQQYGHAWTVHFVQDDLRTTIGTRTRYHNSADLEALACFVTWCTPEEAALTRFDHSIRAWARCHPGSDAEDQ
jgi:hypothetical protein